MYIVCMSKDDGIDIKLIIEITVKFDKHVSIEPIFKSYVDFFKNWMRKFVKFMKWYVN